MVCGSPSRANKFPVLVVLVVVVTVIAFQSQPVVSYHVDDGSAVYYERYPLHGPNKPDNEQIESSNIPIRNESIGNTKEMDDERFSVNCTEPTIQDFPPDMFTQEQRQKGGVVIHFILCIYTMLMIGVVIDEYFVPSLEIIAEVLHMSPDVAGATIMAIGTSSPELFINIVGTFITQGDIGVGTIVGSAAFNILAAPACCGLFTGFAVPLEWWPLTRDCAIYGSIVIGLAVVVSDNRIFWWEAMILVVCYGVFLAVMFCNRTLERWANAVITQFQSCSGKKNKDEIKDKDEQTAMQSGVIDKSPSITKDQIELSDAECPALEDRGSPSPEPQNAAVIEDEPEGPVKFFQPPEGSFTTKLYWYVMWLGNLVFFLTIPDVRRGKKWRRTYPLAFFICILWIGTLSYLVAWFITVIGYTLGIPDSAMGITFLAAGGSVPEGVAAVVVARAGKGSMGISNSVGSNTFDILICMGLPWLIKAAVMPEYPADGNFVAINSGGVVYSVLMLFCTILVLYFAIAFNKFVLDRKIGAILLISYMAFLVLAGCFEMNVFMPVNAPPC
ncbi:sodium/potassium/calcium exchanger 3 [Daphnia magna]|uniref:sodium/potassium/calcium exchanger 3 n=1 Tax=Daphnia magna TaxID=35525 RepID=UPI001E1BA05A|nr:sodium/potassium/calcium exchanger 3 [Daphnia magna]